MGHILVPLRDWSTKGTNAELGRASIDGGAFNTMGNLLRVRKTAMKSRYEQVWRKHWPIREGRKYGYARSGGYYGRDWDV